MGFNYFNHNKVRRMVQEDRLSSLPDELIHKILSSFDIKFVVPTCLISSRWKLLWTSMPYLDFSTDGLNTLSKFAEFVTDLLSRRNHQTEVSSVKLVFHGSVSQDFVRKIAYYALSHNVQDLNFINYPIGHFGNHPPDLFSSQSLKNFTLYHDDLSHTLGTQLDFSVLTTLHLGGMVLYGELFSKCVNLKNLTLQHFSVKDVEVYDIISPRLTNLILIDGHCSKVINLIAPQLEKLTIKNCWIKYLNAPPGLSSLCYRGCDHPPLSEDRLHSLHEVTICFLVYVYWRTKSYKEEDARKIIAILQQLHSARNLTLNAEIIECLSSFPNLLSHHPLALSNLICLTINSAMWIDAYTVETFTEAKNFLLENSPSASLILESPKDC